MNWSTLAACALMVTVSADEALAQAGARVYGAATPQEVVAGMQKAMATGDLGALMPFIAPSGRAELATDGVTGVLMLLAFSNPDDQMPGSKPLPAAELEAKRKGYREASALAKQTLRPFGLDTLIGKPAMSTDSQKAIARAIDKADTVALTSSLFAAMTRMGPMLGMTKSNTLPELFKTDQVTDYRVSGDRATAKAGSETINFIRIDGRWYAEPPK